MEKIQLHTDEELLLFFEQAGCTNQFFQKFKELYINLYIEFAGEESEEDTLEYLNEAKKDALWLTLEKIKSFMKEINYGHCEEWASLIISNALYDNESEYCDYIYDAYYALFKKDKALADREIEIHSKSFGEDELFEKCYTSLFTDGRYAENPIEYSRRYTKCYRELVQQGKTTIYAHHYAQTAAYCEYTELFCEKFAYAMEQMLSQGLREGQAFFIAQEFGQEVCNENVFFYANKNIKYLQENKKYLSKFNKNIPNESTREDMQALIVSLIVSRSEDKLADFVLDSIITHEKNKQN